MIRRLRRTYLLINVKSDSYICFVFNVWSQKQERGRNGNPKEKLYKITIPFCKLHIVSIFKMRITIPCFKDYNIYIVTSIFYNFPCYNIGLKYNIVYYN